MHVCLFSSQKNKIIFHLDMLYMFQPFCIPVRLNSVRIQVRIDSPHPLVCRARRLNGAVLQKRGPVSQQVWHDKDPFLVKGTERRA
jgi:hypothetical protein